jgi:hypothetical protein
MTHYLEPEDASIELQNADLDHVETLIPHCKPNHVIVKERATSKFYIFDAGLWQDIISLGDRLKFKLYYKS